MRSLLRRQMMTPFVAGAVLFAVAMGVGRFAYTPLLVAMRHDVGLSASGAGVLASVNLGGYLVGALMAMIGFANKYRRVIICGGIIGVIASTAAMALPSWAWMPARFVTGVCSALVFVLTVGVVLDYGSVRRSRWGPSILFSGVGAGIAFVGALVPRIAAVYASNGTWIALAVISAVASIAALPSLPADSARSRAVEVRRSAPSGGGAFSLLALMYAVEGAVYIIPATFLVAMVAEVPSLSHFATWSWVVVGLVAAPSPLLWTAVSRKIGSPLALSCAAIVQALALLVPASRGGVASVLLIAVGLGATFMGFGFIASELGRHAWPEKSNAAVGLLTVVYGIGQIIGPLAATRIALLTGSYNNALPFAGAALLIASAPFVVRATRQAMRSRKAAL